MSVRRIRVLAAFDSFKETLEATKACSAVLESLAQADSRVETHAVPLSDGGEGFVEALRTPLNMTVHKMEVVGPLGKPVTASYGVTADGLGVVEMAEAAGLQLIPPAERHPSNVTTHGVGQLIRAALDRGCKKILLGVGGSASNDAGIGALHALGLPITLKGSAEPVPSKTPIFGSDIPKIESVGPDSLLDLDGAKIEVACDVTTPISHCSDVFGRQKGLSEDDVPVWTDHLRRLVALLPRAAFANSTTSSEHPLWGLERSGAAGGMSGGFHAVCGAELVSGIEMMARAHSLDDEIARSDLILTGEGSYDAQTATGKVPCLVLGLAAKHGKKSAVICGRTDIDGDVNPEGVPIYPLVSMFPKEECMNYAEDCVRTMVAAKAREILEPLAE